MAQWVNVSLVARRKQSSLPGDSSASQLFHVVYGAAIPAQTSTLLFTSRLPAINYLSSLLEEISEQKWIRILLCHFHLHNIWPELDASNSNIPVLWACWISSPPPLISLFPSSLTGTLLAALCPSEALPRWRVNVAPPMQCSLPPSWACSQPSKDQSMMCTKSPLPNSSCMAN